MTFYNTMLSRMAMIKSGRLSDPETGDDLSDVETTLRGLGIALRSSDSEFRNFGAVLDEVAAKWNEFSSVQQRAIATAFAGTRQQTRFLALMQGYQDAASYAETAADSIGVSEQKMEIYEKSLEGRRNRMTASFEGMAQTVIPDELIGLVYDLGSALSELIAIGDGVPARITAITVAVYGLGTAIQMLKTSEMAAAFTSFSTSIAGIPKQLSSLAVATELLTTIGNAAEGARMTDVAVKELAAALSILGPAKSMDIALDKKLTAAQFETIIGITTMTDEEKQEVIARYAVIAAKEADSAATDVMTAKTVTLGNAMKGLWLSHPWLVIIGAIATAIGAAAIAYDQYQRSIRESIERANELQEAHRNNIDALNDQTDKVKDLAKEFKQLSAGVSENGENISLSSSEYSQYLSIVKELVDINPSLVKAYNDEGQAIINKNAAIERTIELLEQQRKEELRSAQSNDKNWEIMQGTSNLYKQANDELIKKREEFTRSLMVGIMSSADAVEYATNGNNGRSEVRINGFSNATIDEMAENIREIFGYNVNDYGDSSLKSTWDKMFADMTKSADAMTIAVKTDLSSLYRYMGVDSVAALNNARDALASAEQSRDEAANGFQEQLNIIAQAQDGYEKLNEGSREFMTSWISTMKIGADETRQTTTDMANAIRGMVTLLSDESFSKDGSALQQYFNELFSLDFSQMNVGEVTDWVKYAEDVIAKIQEILTSQGKELTQEELDAIRLAIGLDISFITPDGTVIKTRGEYLSYVSDLIERKFGEGVSGRLGTLSVGELDVLGKMDLSGFDNFDDVIDSLRYVPDVVEDIVLISDLLSQITQDSDILRFSMEALNRSSEDFAIFLGEIGDNNKTNLENLLKEFPNLRDEIERYSKAMESGINTLDAYNELQEELNDAMIDFRTDEIVKQVKTLVSAYEDYGAGSNQVLEAMQNIEMYVPGLVSALYNTDGALNSVGTAALSSADAFYEFMNAQLEAMKQAAATDYSSVIDQLGEVARAAITAKLAMTLQTMPYVEGESDSIMKDLTQKYITDLQSSVGTARTYASNTKKSTGSSSKKKDVEEYVAELGELQNKLRELQLLENEIDRENMRIDLYDDDEYQQQIKHQQTLIEMYQKQQEAIHGVADARRKLIDQNIEKLTDQGFDIEYDADNAEILIKNIEHVNDLTAKSKGKYDSLQEATNELRKETEKLIEKTLEQVDANRENGDAWTQLNVSIRDARLEIVNSLNSIATAAGDPINKLGTMYSTLQDAADEYASNGGFISVTALKSIYDLGPQYMQYLSDENGLLVINEKKINNVIAAKIKDLALTQAATYVERVRLAALGESNEKLDELTLATESATGTTWELVYAQLESIKATGKITDEQYQGALHNIQAIQSLAENVIDNLGQVEGSALKTLNDMKDGLDDILDYVMDMIKQKISDQVDSLKEMKDAYSEIIDQKKESLEASKKETSYQKTISDKLKEIAKIQAKIDALSLDNSRSAQAERTKLLEEFTSLQEDLAETQTEESVEAQKTALEEMEKSYADEKDAEIKVLEDSIDSTEKLYRKAIEYISDNWEDLKDDLIQWNYDAGSKLESELVKAWDNAYAAAQKYGDYVTALKSIDKDITIMSGGDETYLPSSVIGSSSSGTSSGTNSDTDQVKKIAAKMRSIGSLWSTSNSAEENESLHQQVAAEAAKLSQYGIQLRYDPSSGVWYIVNDKINPGNKGKSFIGVYGSYSDEKDAEIKELEDSIDSAESLYQKAIKYISNNWENLKDKLVQWGDYVGSNLESSLVSAWDAAYTAAKKYLGFVSSSSSIVDDVITDSGSDGTPSAPAALDKNDYSDVSTSAPSALDGNDYNTESNAKYVKEIAAKMRSIGSKWSSSNSAEKNNDLHNQVAAEAAKLSKYGVQLRYDPSSGIWYIIDDKINPGNKGKSFISVYHSGGIVGGRGSSKDNEVLAKLERNEAVLTRDMWDKVVTMMDRISKIDDVADRFVGASGYAARMSLSGAISDLNSSIASSISNNNHPVNISIGDTIIQGNASAETVRQHAQVNRDMMNQIARQMGLMF